jgi:hypothetical protein
MSVTEQIVTTSNRIPDGTELVTPEGQPNIVVNVMLPITQVFVRAARTYLQSLIGFLGVLLGAKPILSNLGVTITATDFWSMFLLAASMAVAPTMMSLLQNCVELLSSFDQMFPRARA